MNTTHQFNKLDGQTVSRSHLQSLLNDAKLENNVEVVSRVLTVLNKFPDDQTFLLTINKPIHVIGLGVPSVQDLKKLEAKGGLVIYMIGDKKVAEVEPNGTLHWHEKGLGKAVRNVIRQKAHQGLGAARHSGVAIDGLDECGRLQPGYKFEGSRVVQVSKAAKRPPVQNNRNAKETTTKKVVEKPAKKASNYGKKTPFLSKKKQPLETNADNKKFDFLYEVGYNGSYPIKSFIEFPKMQGLTNEGKTSTVENLISYRATKNALGKLQKLYPNNSYGKKYRLQAKDLNKVASSSIEEIAPKERILKSASNYGKTRKFVSKKVVLFSKDDIPYEVAYRAHTGTSFSPEKRAKSEQENYFNEMQAVYNENLERAKKLKLESELNARFLRFKEKYLKLELDYLRSRSGVFSTMIAGPSNFPVDRMRKKNAIVDSKMKTSLDYFNKYQNLFYNEMKPVIIKTGSSTALDQLKEKLRKEEEAHSQTLSFNKIMRKKVSNEQKEKELTAAGISKITIEYARKNGFHELGSYVSSNRSARIRELKRRIKVEENIKVKSETVGNLEYYFDGGKVVKNLEINRLQIHFDSIPDATLRAALKKGGLAFKWSPSNQTWQRQLNTFYSGSYIDLEKLLPGLSFEKKKSEPKTVEKTKNDTSIKRLALNNINLDSKRFQNRSKLNETVLKNIIENFNETELDPLIVWIDKDKKTYLLAGHHRHEGLTRLKKKDAPIKYFSGTEAQAIEFAKVKSNSNRSLETPIERAKVYREMLATKTKAQVKTEAEKLEGKNASFILNLAALNPKGETIQALEAMQNTNDKQNATLIEKVADWNGQARRNYDQLTNAHEKEIFTFLMNKDESKRMKTKADFLQKIYAIAGSFDFDNDKPLNLFRFKYQTEGEKVYNTEYNDLVLLLQNTIKEKSDLLDRLSNPLNPDFIAATDIETSDLAAKKLVSLNQQIAKHQAKLIELSKTKSNYIKGGTNQVGLFSPADVVMLPEDVFKTHQNGIPTELSAVSKETRQNPKANKLMQMHFDSLQMDEGYEDLMQEPAKNMKIAIWGAPKNGKTSGALQLANYLTKFGNVLYNFCDQGFNKSTQKLWIDSGLVNKENATPSDISSTADLEKELRTGNFDFCFIDMISDYIRTEKLKPEEFKERFIKQFPNISFILIFEVTKEGNFKGDQGWTHLVDAIMTVKDFLIENRGRYGTGEKVIWEEGFKKFNPKRYEEWQANQWKEAEETTEEVEFSDYVEVI